MADLNLPVRAPANGAKPRAKRLSTRMDFTPMVDLGFLLITFFMLTTILSKPVVMSLALPDKGDETTPLKASKALTLLLGSRDSVFYYEEEDLGGLKSATFGAESLRHVILEKKERVKRQFGLEQYTDHKTGRKADGSYLNVIIKPGKSSRYKNVVDVLDEMAICRVRYYTIMDMSPEEASHIQ